MEKSEILENLCSYDKRNPYYISDDGKPARPADCHCENCFYGRHELASMLLDSLEKVSVLLDLLEKASMLLDLLEKTGKK